MPHLPLTAEESAERLSGVALICGAALMFTLIDTSAKYAAAHLVPTLEIVWVRYALSLLFSAIVLRPWRHWSAYVTHRPWAQLIRAVLLLGSTVFNFIAIQHLQLAQTASINFASPLLVTAAAGPILGEWAGPRRWAAVIVGFLGIIVIMQPTPGTFQPVALFSVASSACYAGYALSTRLLSATESAGSLLIYGSLPSVLFLTPTVPAVAVLPPTWIVAGTLVLMGLVAGLGHWFLILASRRAPATVLAPFTYTQVLWMVASGYLVFGDLPGLSTLAGAVIVIGSGLYLLYRERVHRDS